MQQHCQEQATVGARVQPREGYRHCGYLQHEYWKGLLIGIAAPNKKLWQMPHAPNEPEQYTSARKSEALGQSGKGIAAPTNFLSGLKWRRKRDGCRNQIPL